MRHGGLTRFATAIALGLLLPGWGCEGSGVDRSRPESPVSEGSEGDLPRPESALSETAPAGTSAAATSLAAPAAESSAGFVVWESNRGGAYRIWRQELSQGGRPTQISPEEPGRDHCCAKLSPDGRRLVYLSLPGGSRQYRPDAGALHIADADGGRDRILVAAARHYGEHRAAVWWGIDELQYLDGDGRSVLRRISTATTKILATPAANAEGWLFAPGGGCATGGTPTFSDPDPAGGVRERPSMGGCQPAFSADGRRAVWSAGAGGPIDAIDLATRRSWTLITKNDPRLPEGRRYVYFPMLSADSSLLAIAGSNGEHDHFRSDYDVVVIDLDPATLAPIGEGRIVAPHPAVDRFPDPFRAPFSSGVVATTAGPPATAPHGERGRGPVLAWDTNDPRAGAPGDSAVLVKPQGRAWYDRSGAMALDGGRFAPDAGVGETLTRSLKDTNQLSLALRLTPAALDQQGALVALSNGARRRAFVVRQNGKRIELVLRTSETPREGSAVTIATLAAAAPVHLLLSFSPGRLTTFVDGAPAGATVPFPGDFFHWKETPLAFGGETGEAAIWRGTISHIAIWNRELESIEAEKETARVRENLARAPEVARIVVEARVLRTSPAPALESISPYREALAVDEIEILRAIAGPAAGASRLRRVRWAILDGRTLDAPPAGAVERLVLEPFAAQPQLEPFFLADELGSDSPLWFDLGGTAGR